ncbi:MAG: hypothetical protein H3Z49_07590 [archaeon]|nr:hypothetical protein [archaeon]
MKVKQDEQRRFPIVALLVLVLGLVAVALVISISFSPALYSAEAVDSIEQAEELVERYLSSLGGGYRIEEIMEFSNHFYIIVQEKSTGINAFELLVDRYTGRIGFEPGPNMMWNQKYGHMGRVGNPTASMPIDAKEASGYGQRWLDTNIPGASVEEPKMFYGYYTMDVSIDGRMSGMLSVNGYTGDVWYHSWHGEFIGMEEHN